MGTCLFPVYKHVIKFKGFSFKGFIILGLVSVIRGVIGGVTLGM